MTVMPLPRRKGAFTVMVYVQGADAMHQFPDFGHDLTTGLWLPNGQPNRCQGITRDNRWCGNPVLPVKAFPAMHDPDVGTYLMNEVGFSAMESGLCRVHRGTAS